MFALRGRVVILLTMLFIGCTCGQVQESAFGGFESRDHANAHSGHRVAGGGVLGRNDPASIHDGEWGLAEALADQLGLDRSVGEVPVTDIVAGWLHSAGWLHGGALAQVSATNEQATSPIGLILAAREVLSVAARFNQVESIVGSP
jgi:hypothetical protein